MIQVLLQIEKCVVEYMCHPAALQISKSNFTCQETSPIVYITYTIHLFIGQAKFLCIQGITTLAFLHLADRTEHGIKACILHTKTICAIST